MADKDSVVVRAAIHPSIGVARVGNSQDDYFIGPEVTDPKPEDPGFYRDAKGALKRQAARFRIYGYNAAGEVVRELTAADARIEWHVHVANQKSAWYDFHVALDSKEALAGLAHDMRAPKLRNADIKADRGALVIDPGPRTISGPSESGTCYAFDSGTFLGTQVYLGELRTDDRGRLLFLGGRGHSASVDGQPPQDFANNDGWHDDISDGPVEARVTLDGREIPVDGAWVIAAPPNYGPQLKSVRTMYDLMTDVAVQAGMMPLPDRPSFHDDILPILQRMTDLQWANAGFATGFGHGMAYDFRDPSWIEALADASDARKELRRQIANAFRDYDRDSYAPQPWPWIYGDAMSVPAAKVPEQNAVLSNTQLHLLHCWAEGDFSVGTPRAPHDFHDVPVARQPATLDRAAMEFCLADAFHPGCEMTWPMRHASMYRAPYRIRGGGEVPDGRKPPYGTRLAPEVALSQGGPLYNQAPGGITRWMAVPWQTDTASCRSGYSASLGYGRPYDPYLPTFWPARVPNQVLSEADYAIAVDDSKSRDERVAAFNRRCNWFQTLGDQGYLSQIDNMVTRFPWMGVIEYRPGVQGDPDLPPVMQVATLGPDAPAYDSQAVGLVPVHLEDATAETSETEARAEAARDTRLPEEQVVAGYIRKVARSKVRR